MKRVTAKEFQEAVDVNQIAITGSNSDLLFNVTESLRYYDNMQGEAFRAPNLGNATDGFLVDELGDVRSEIKPRQTYEKLLSGLLKTKMDGGLLEKIGDDGVSLVKLVDGDTVAGEVYTGTFKWVSKMIPDGDKLKAYLMDPAGFEASLGHRVAIEDLQKPSEYWEIRTKAIAKT